MKKAITILLTAILIYIALSQKANILETIESGENAAVVAGVLFVALLVFFPVIPFSVAAGFIGSLMGLAKGVLICVSGAMIGTMAMFWMARYGFRDWTKRTLSRYPAVRRYEGYFDQYAFAAILGARIIPVVPAPIVNILSGVSNVRSLIFFTASLLGKLPSIIIFTLAGRMFEQSKTASLLIYGFYFVILASAVTVYYRRKGLPS